MPQPSMEVRRGKVSVVPLPLTPSPLLSVQLQRLGWQWRRSPRIPVPVLVVGPWGSRFPTVCPTPLSPYLVVGGGADIPPTPFLS